MNRFFKTAAAALAIIMLLSVFSVLSMAEGTITWREWIKDYEEWTDQYIACVDKLVENPSDPTLIAEYAKLIEKTAQWSQDSEKFKEELTDSDLAEFIKEYTRILQKYNAALQKYSSISQTPAETTPTNSAGSTATEGAPQTFDPGILLFTSAASISVVGIVITKKRR